MQQIFPEPDGRILYEIENYSYEDGFGICGWINNKRVLLGSRDHMTNHSIEGLPSKLKEAEYTAGGKDALYLSVSGNITALFVVTLRADRYIKRWARKLSHSHVCIVTKTVDPCVTEEKLYTLLGVPSDMVRVIPKRLHEDFDEESKRAVRLSASLACTGKFTSVAQLLLSLKTVHSAAVAGLVIQTVSALLGIGLSVMLILSKAFAVSYVYMSASALVIYSLFFTLLAYLVASLRRTR